MQVVHSCMRVGVCMCVCAEGEWLHMPLGAWTAQLMLAAKLKCKHGAARRVQAWHACCAMVVSPCMHAHVDRRAGNMCKHAEPVQDLATRPLIG